MEYGASGTPVPKRGSDHRSGPFALPSNGPAQGAPRSDTSAPAGPAGSDAQPAPEIVHVITDLGGRRQPTADGPWYVHAELWVNEPAEKAWQDNLRRARAAAKAAAAEGMAGAAGFRLDQWQRDMLYRIYADRVNKPSDFTRFNMGGFFG